MLVVPADRHVDFTRIGRILGRQEIYLATEREFEGFFPDCEVGAIPPLGNLYELLVYLDEDLAHEHELTFPVGNHRESITIPMEAFMRLAHPVRAPVRRCVMAVCFESGHDQPG